jgi:anti-anti-sigma factor
MGSSVDGREGLWLSAEQHGSVMVVTIRGDLVIVTSGRFDDCLKQARATSKRVILDLAGVDFMDTSALAVIVGHWKKLKAEDGTLILAGARYRYTKSLWITGLADRLPLYDTAELAIAAEERGTAGGPADAAAGSAAADEAADNAVADNAVAGEAAAAD